MLEQNAIIGTVNPPEANERNGVKIQAFDRDLPSIERRTGNIPQLLGEAITDAEGRFQLNYSLEQFQSGEAVSTLRRSRGKNADLSFQVFDKSGQELSIKSIEALNREYRSGEIIFNAPASLEVSIFVEATQPSGSSEYEQLIALLAPAIEDLSLAELSDEDVVFLVNELGLEQQHDMQLRIQWLRRSALLAAGRQLPVASFYGWGRKDMPAMLSEIATTDAAHMPAVSEKIFSHASDVLLSLLQKAVSENIIPASIREQFNSIKIEIDRLNVEHGSLIARRFVGRLVDENSGEPLVGLAVQGFDLDAGEEPKNLGQDVTNTTGLFSFPYLLSKNADNPPPRKFKLEITLDQQTQAKQTIEVEAGSDNEVIDIKVSLPSTQIPAVPIAQLVQQLGIDLPENLNSFLTGKNITNLQEIRRAGGTTGLKGLPVAADHPGIQLLDAHADLDRLSSDPATNAVLIQKNYNSVFSIATANRSRFVEDMHGQVGDFNAAALHVSANAQTAVLNQILIGRAVENANGFAYDAVAEDVDNPGVADGADAADAADGIDHPCSCQDCEAAVSPIAYLADLLKYTIQHVQNGSAAVSLSDLTAAFHQPFGSLETSCESASYEVRQVRIAVEVLRSYLKAHPPSAAQQSALDAADRNYLIATYTSLLPKWGASYDELRSTHTASAADRETLAGRLGINVSRLDSVVFDPATITALELEQLSGLVDTTRDPLAAGPLPDFQTWRLEALRSLWTIQDGQPGKLPVIDPDLIGPANIKNPVAGDAAFDLWQNRSASIAAQEALLTASPKTLAGLNHILTQSLGISLADFLQIGDEYEKGNTIAKSLDAISLDLDAFLYLLHVQALAADGNPLLDEEWKAVYAILVQVWKKQHFTAWQTEEKTGGIIQSADFFQIPPSPPPTFPVLTVSATDRWRAPLDARSDWQDNLQTRLDQEENLIRAIRDAVSTTEATTLTMLRDALILASDAPGPDLIAKAEWVALNLLVDGRMDGCAMTTRVAQALETIQGLLMSLRASQIRPNFKTFILNADNFDAEWKWLGSYATWRPAMFVFMYPENISNPGLKRPSSADFMELVRKTQSSGRITPSVACSLARTYAGYYRDVCSLNVLASCTTRTRLLQDDDSCKGEVGYRCLLHMFARSSVSGKIYWSTLDTLNLSQTFWTEVGAGISGFDHIVDIIGATPYQVSPEQRFIYLFVKKAVISGEYLGYLRFDLEKIRWEEEFSLMQLAASFKAVVRQRQIETAEPHVAVSLPVPLGRGVFENKIRKDGTGWADGGFQLLVKFGDPVAMIDTSNVGFYLLVENSVVTGYRFLPWNVTARPNYHAEPNARFKGVASTQFSHQPPGQTQQFPDVGTFLGAFGLPQGDYMYVITASMVNTQKGAHVHYVNDNGTQLLDKLELTSPFGTAEPRIAPSSGIADGDALKTRIIQQLYGGVAVAETIGNFAGQQNKTLFIKNPRAVMPLVSGLFDIPGRLSPKDLLLRKALVKKAYMDNQSGPSSNLAYLQEAYFLVPVQLALGLQRSGEFVAALDWLRTVYDYTAPERVRKIYYGLVAEESLADTYKRFTDWLIDPLNPHAIAATRRNCYTRYIVQTVINCLLDYADTQFTADTSESNALARRLYVIVLELMDSAALKQMLNDCPEIIGVIDDGILGPQWAANVHTLKGQLNTIPKIADLNRAVEQVKTILTGVGTAQQRFSQARDIVNTALRTVTVSKMENVLEKNLQDNVRMQQSAFRAVETERAVQSAGQAAANDFQHRVSMVTGFTSAQLLSDRKPLTWLRQPVLRGVPVSAPASTIPITDRTDAGRIDALLPSHIGNLANWSANEPMTALSASGSMVPEFSAPAITGFCIPPNPMLKALRLRAELNLFKLRTCRNIAGMKRDVAPYAAATNTVNGLPVAGASGQIILPGMPSIQPTLYRYAVLIERAKQLVQLAAQIEASLLASLEKSADAAYNLLKAKQDLGLAQANVTLQTLHLTQSQHGISLAEQQKSRAEITVGHFQSLIQEGLLASEQQAIALMDEAAFAYRDAATYSFAAAAASGAAVIAGAVAAGIGGAAAGSAAAPGPGTAAGAAAGSAAGAVVGAIAQGLGGVASAFSALASGYSGLGAKNQARASILQTQASYERRQQDWELQVALGNKDVEIGQEQVIIATDQKLIAEQEKTIAELQTTNARDTIEFLNNKFTNQDLYDWMSGILEDVCCYFLCQATSISLLAQNQLAFERQETPPAYIRRDYWQTPGDNNGTDTQSPDRKGLTGSAQLLRDITQLDQYAFETNKRKLQLSKTISLALLAPAEFRRFVDTGILVFATPMEIFDRNFPGHYMRLIRRVRTSVIALIPPGQGISATLTTSGLSRIVVGPDIFQTVPIRRDPESIALSSPINASGLFELDPLQTDMLFPFENNGLDGLWEFRMPKPANLFDYRSIKDVLVTFDYTALNSYDYYLQVIQNLNPKFSADRPVSFRNQLPDQWYDLHNPDQTNTPMSVTFSMAREDFPPNLDDIRIQQVLLYFSRADGKNFEITIDQLEFTEKGGTPLQGGPASSIDATVSTRRGNGSSWSAAFTGKVPFGEWKLSLPNNSTVKKLFTDDDVMDILFVVTYSGKTPAWPS